MIFHITCHHQCLHFIALCVALCVAFRFPGRLRCSLDLWDLRRPLSPAAPHGVADGIDGWQAMQQLHPILAQTECEEAARPWQCRQVSTAKHIKTQIYDDL